MTADRRRYKARWIVPVSSEPLTDAVIEVERGTITAIHNRPDPTAENLGNVAILPGLINAHTHLEFSDLRTPVAPPQPFSQWIRNVVAQRRARSDDTSVRSIEQGRDESVRAGVTTLGEIATDDTPLQVLTEGPRAVVFRELRGLRSEAYDDQHAAAVRHITQNRKSSDIVPGLSPHAPYSVHPRLYEAAISLAAEHDVPLAVHLAETPAEIELLRHGTADLRQLLDDFGVWEPGALERGTRPMDYLRPLERVRRALVVHGNYLDADEQAFVSVTPNLAVVYCPRTHAYFGHSPHPWRSLLDAGATVVVGTDSRASNPDLDLWQELRFLHRLAPGMSPQVLLRMATMDAARALGFEAVTGRLAPGYSADWCVLALDGGVSDLDAHLFDPANRVARCMYRGEWMKNPGR